MANRNSIRDINARIFHKLLDVVPDLLTIEEHGKSVVSGYMDLNLDILHRNPERIIIALSHYYKHHSGDMIADPDMEIAVYPSREYAEALTYQDAYSYQSVLQDEGVVDAKLQRDLNDFLSQWLTNLKQQGHLVKADDLGDGSEENANIVVANIAGAVL